MIRILVFTLILVKHAEIPYYILKVLFALTFLFYFSSY